MDVPSRGWKSLWVTLHSTFGKDLRELGHIFENPALTDSSGAGQSTQIIGLGRSDFPPWLS